ncbi:MAG: carbon-nitrogen family hydrolase [Motilibacteraceae bacterium]
MRVSVLQLDVDLDVPVDQRRAAVAEQVRGEAGSDLVVLPELWPQGAFGYPLWRDLAEPLDGPTVRTLSAAARDARAHLHCGSFIERDGDRMFNTSVVVGPDGEVRAVYRKVHLFGFDEGEPTLLAAGSEPVVWDAPWGRTGLATCYDLRFPELFRALVDRGAELLLLVAGWPERRAEHWQVLTRARAIEDQLLVVACGTSGTQLGTAMAGRSMVVDPWGAVLAQAGVDAGVLRADVDLAQVAQTRERFPVLRDRVLGNPVGGRERVGG